MAAGSRGGPPLPGGLLLIHCTPHQASLLLGTNPDCSLHAFFIHSTKHIECFSICQGPCLPRAVVERSVGTKKRLCLSYLFMFQQPQRAWHREGVQKHLLVLILLVLQESLLQLILSRGPERGRARGDPGGRDLCSSCSCCLRVCSGPLSFRGASSSSGHYAQVYSGQICPRSGETTMLFPQWTYRL